MNWFLYDRGLRYERVKCNISMKLTMKVRSFYVPLDVLLKSKRADEGLGAHHTVMPFCQNYFWDKLFSK